MTVIQIKSLASDNQYSINARIKSELIEEFLKAQEGIK